MEAGVSGPNTQPGQNGTAFGRDNGDNGTETTAGHILWMAGIMRDVTIADVWDVTDNTICVEYV